MRGATLIVLAWNQWPLTQRCLESLLGSALDAAEIIVVDNGSSDATPEGLAAYADRVRIVHLPENLGFVRGMNAGIEAARADDDVVLLNNDLVFSQHDWLGRLRDAAYAAADHGIVGCRLLGPAPEHRLFHTGGFIEPESLWGQQTESGQQEPDVAQFTRTRRVQGIAFAVAYLRRDCLDRVGVLDEAYHSYFEDTDYCLRAADAGIATIVAGNVTLGHDQHGSTLDDGGFRERLWKASRETFAARWQQRLIDAYRGTVVWHGVTRDPHPSAQLAHQLLWRLDARGLRMAFTAVTRELFDGHDFRLELAARRSLPPQPEIALICAREPTHPVSGRYRAALTFGEWETLPEKWVTQCNALDAVLVPDAFQAEVFRRSGVIQPIEIVALGIDRDYCHANVPAPRQPEGRFVFLSVAEQFARDAPDRIVQAFRDAFRADEAVELVVHICPGDDELVIRDALDPLLAASDGARVRIMLGWGFPAHERAQLLSTADAYVSARRGGGWDPLVRESLACARIVIAPAWGSQAELIKSWGTPVGTLGYVEDPAQPGCRWAEPDTASLAQCLRDAFENRIALAAQMRARSEAFAATHDLDASADRLVELLATAGALRAKPPPPPPHRLDGPDARVSGQILVLGMHRSGTSSVGGLLNLFGAWAGPDDLLLRGPDNPKGHFEHGELHMACLRRLAAAGGDWRDPPHRDAPAAAIDAFRREVAPVFDSLEPRRPWFAKEPRLCLLARELLPLLTHPLFVHVVRDPVAIARSLNHRDGMPLETALALWERYTRDAFAASAGWPRILVDYDALVGDPLATARHLFDELRERGLQGLTFPDAGAITQWIEPGGPIRIDDTTLLTPSQSTLLAAIRDRSILD